MVKRPRFSVCIPYYPAMENAEFFMTRCMESVHRQEFQDFEIVVTQNGTMAENANAGIRKATGEIIKMLFMDDYLADQYCLGEIDRAFDDDCKWLATGCVHKGEGPHLFNRHYPAWTDDILLGNNHIGSPSVVSFRNDDPPLFDEAMGWLLDCDLYWRLYLRYGTPKLLYEYSVVIGIHSGQATNTLSDELKLQEQQYLHEKHTTV